jgi:hypothetical protein
MITASKAEVLQGTLDLLVLKTLDTIGPLHGFGIARRIQQTSADMLAGGRPFPRRASSFFRRVVVEA